MYLKERHGQAAIFPTEDGWFHLDSYNDHDNFEVVNTGGIRGNFDFRTPTSQSSPIPELLRRLIM